MATVERKPLDVAERLRLYARAQWQCVYCGISVVTPKEVNRQLDHAAVAHAAGGVGDASNLVLACQRCNLAKSTTPLATWIASNTLEAICKRHNTTYDGPDAIMQRVVAQLNASLPSGVRSSKVSPDGLRWNNQVLIITKEFYMANKEAMDTCYTDNMFVDYKAFYVE